MRPHQGGTAASVGCRNRLCRCLGSRGLDRSSRTGPALWTQHVDRVHEKAEDAKGGGMAYFDADTYANEYSERAARLAAGSSIIDPLMVVMIVL